MINETSIRYIGNGDNPCLGICLNGVYPCEMLWGHVSQGGMAVPVHFLTAEQAAQYGRYAGEPSSAQLAQYFFLDDADCAFLRPLRQAETRWGCALQLGTVRFLGTFVDGPTNVPAGVLTYVAVQLDLPGPMDIERYWRGRTHWHHQAGIIRQYHYHDFDAQPGHWRFVRWLYTRSWMAAERPSVLFDQATV